MSHPAIQEADVRHEGPPHPTTSFLPGVWRRRDEWYDYKANPRSRVQVLATVDEGTYQGGRMGSDHPITWCHEFGGGRSWYTGMGHTAETYADPLFMRMIAEAIVWVAPKPGTTSEHQAALGGASPVPRGGLLGSCGVHCSRGSSF
jgi:type 1 glutamine amidotransferase